MPAKPGTSITVFPLHLGGSNGSKLELNAIFVPPYNAARYGIRLTSSPRQADVVLLLGQATAKLIDPALALIASLPPHVKLIQVGSDATSAAPFAQAYASLGPIVAATAPASDNETTPNPTTAATTLPAGRTIAAYVAGSPPDPQVILQAILDAGR